MTVIFYAENIAKGRDPHGYHRFNRVGNFEKDPMSAYDIQKLVEYRKISKWVKISTPSIYKKAIQLEEKGLIRGEIVKEGKMPEKSNLLPNGSRRSRI